MSMGMLQEILPNARRITPGVGGRHTPVSLAYRKIGKRMAMVVSVSAEVGRRLGFDPATANMVEVVRDEISGLLALCRRHDAETAADAEWLWKLQHRNGTWVLTLPAGGLGDRTYSAERAVHHVEERGKVTLLRISLPDWAAPQKRGTALAAAAAAEMRRKMA